MDENEEYHGYTPIWNYTASGVNWIFRQDTWKGDNVDDKHPWCLPEGLKLILIISMASTIEGALRSYLRAKIRYALQRQNELEGILSKPDETDTTTSDSTYEGPYVEIEDDFIPSLTTREELEQEYHQKLALLRKSAKLNDGRITQAFNSIKNVGKQLINWIPRLNFQDEKFSDDEKQNLEAVLDVVEGSSWSLLKGYFNEINEVELSDVLHNSDPELFNDLNALFDFRNFIVHSNTLEQKFGEKFVDFRGKSERLIGYIREKGFYPSSIDNKYFIEILLPDDLITHFKKCQDLFFRSSVFDDSHETHNQISMIWRR